MAEGDEPRVIADVTSYEQMLAALRARVNELQLNGERFDEFAGLPRGYLSKLIGARPIRRLGMTSFGPVLAGLGLRLLVIEDNAATERLKNRLPPRNSSFVRAAPSIVLTVRYFKKFGRKGAQARVDISTKEQRRGWAKKAATARWQKATSWRVSCNSGSWCRLQRPAKNSPVTTAVQLVPERRIGGPCPRLVSI